MSRKNLKILWKGTSEPLQVVITLYYVNCQTMTMAFSELRDEK